MSLIRGLAQEVFPLAPCKGGEGRGEGVAKPRSCHAFSYRKQYRICNIHYSKVAPRLPCRPVSVSIKTHPRGEQQAVPITFAAPRFRDAQTAERSDAACVHAPEGYGQNRSLYVTTATRRARPRLLTSRSRGAHSIATPVAEASDALAFGKSLMHEEGNIRGPTYSDRGRNTDRGGPWLAKEPKKPFQSG